MGSYSAICAVSGLPIHYSREVVGFELEPYRWDASKHRYVPRGLPVFGKYDDGGGIEGQCLSLNSALIHRAIWDDAESYWHYMDRKAGRNFLDFKSAMEKAKNEAESDRRHKEAGIKPHWGNEMSPTDYLFYSLRHYYNETDEGLMLQEILHAKNFNFTGIPEGLNFLQRSEFMEIILKKVIEGTWTEIDQDNLYKMVMLYGGQMITGRQIAPSNQPYVEQFPEYKQRISLMSKHLKMARAFKKQQDDDRKKYS